jgi:uncharacterized lipoprotein YmbA
MTTPAAHRLLLPFAAGLFLFLAGCNIATPAQDDPTRYYVLTQPSAPEAKAEQPGVRIGLKTVVLEGYLKHREMVVRTAHNEIEFRDYRLWAEPLDSAITRALRTTLLASPGVGQVYAEPFPLDHDRDYDVTVELLRCEGDTPSSGDAFASLSATLEITTAGPGGHVVYRATYAAPHGAWNGSDFNQLAGLLSKAVGDLGHEIAARVPPKT